MKSLAHLSDAVLRRELIAAVVRDRATTAELLAHIAEFDARKLYVPEGYSSMHAYCVGELRLSEDAAAKRIQAARVARKFPDLLAALTEGRLHLTAVCLLAPHLTVGNVDELIEAASHQRKTDIEMLLARRFAASEMPATVQAVSAVSPLVAQHAPAHVAPGGLFAAEATNEPCAGGDGHSPAHVDGGEHPPAHIGGTEHAPAHAENGCTAAIAERFLVRVTIGKGTHEKLRYAQALLSHSVPSGDLAQVLDRALDALIAQIEKRKLGIGSTRKARPVPNRPQVRGRYISAPIRRAVWERDGGRCTFVSRNGHRCDERRFLEFDHVEPVARGGTATVHGVRLRCRAHNQYEAERVFGAGFMRRKREDAWLAAAGARKRALSGGPRETLPHEELATVQAIAEEQAARAATTQQTQDVLAGLRGLGCRMDEARRAARFTETLQDASLEERMRVALGFISRRFTHGAGSAGTTHAQG